jgi:hypothetical protein
MMAGKTKIRDRYELLVVVDMIHILRKLRLLSGVNIYPEVLKLVTTILAFVVRVPEDRPI